MFPLKKYDALLLYNTTLIPLKKETSPLPSSLAWTGLPLLPKFSSPTNLRNGRQKLPSQPRSLLSPSPTDSTRRPSLAASCAAAASAAVLLIFVPALVLFLVFRPRDPTLSVTSVHLNSTTFVQSSSVLNPNRAAFSHYDSTVVLLYRGSQLGFMYIPAGEIQGGRTQRLEASLAVEGFRPASVGPDAQVESRVRLKGRVRVLRFFMHRVEVTAACRIDVASGGGAVVGVRC